MAGRYTRRQSQVLCNHILGKHLDRYYGSCINFNENFNQWDKALTVSEPGRGHGLVMELAISAGELANMGDREGFMVSIQNVRQFPKHV